MAEVTASTPKTTEINKGSERPPTEPIQEKVPIARQAEELLKKIWRGFSRNPVNPDATLQDIVSNDPEDVQTVKPAEAVPEPSQEDEQEKKPTRHPYLPKIAEFPEKIRPEIQAFYEKTKLAADKIRALIQNGNIGVNGIELNRIWWEGQIPYMGSYVSQEAVAILDDLEPTIIEATANFPAHELDEFTRRLAQAKQSIREIEKKNEEFPNSKDLLIHSIGFNPNLGKEKTEFQEGLLRNILERGVLASRKYQIDHFGESRFTTSGGVVMGKDFVEIVENGVKRRLTPPEYQSWSSKNQPGSRKDIGTELHQLYFTEPTGDNASWHPYFSVSFVFSKASLFSQAQHYRSEGTQLYDRAYDYSDPESPGFSVDLTKEPVLLIVEDVARDAFLKFIREQGANSPLLQGQDIDSWIEQNVMFSPPGSYVNDLDKYREFYKNVQERFFNRRPNPNIPPGKFMPSGAFGGLSGKDMLYIYQ